MIVRYKRQTTTLLLSSLLLCVVLTVTTFGPFVSTNSKILAGAEEDEDDDDEEEPYRSVHAQHLEATELEQLQSIDFGFGDGSSSSTSTTPERMAAETMSVLTSDLQQRLTDLFRHTKTPECRAKIAQHMGYHVQALALEEPLPFTTTLFENTCVNDTSSTWDFDNLPPGVHMGIIQNRTYQPPRNNNESVVYLEPEEIRLVYGILAHDDAEATIRLIEALSHKEPTTQFLVHVDAKYDETHHRLQDYAVKHNHKHNKISILEDPFRVRVNWGGFSMVNATLQLFHHADQLDNNFTHFVHVAASAYPIASNRRIRLTLAQYPADANFFHVILKPARPGFQVWNYFVECDDRLHRISQLPPLRKETHGIDQYTSSQWFIASRDYVHFVAHPEESEFLHDFIEYAQHMVVADETFFGTILRATPFCHKHHNRNYLHLLFDLWENERDISKRDERKCVMPDPNHCGRSPTTITLDYLDILELTDDLFARKFQDDVDPKIKDIIDMQRAREEQELLDNKATVPPPRGETVNLLMSGHGALIVAKETVHSEQPLCLGLGERQNKAKLVPCFHDWVPPTLASDWETGGVIVDETLDHNRWEIAPCSSDGNLERLESGDIKVTPGLYTPTGPRCMLRMMEGIRTGRCLDGESLDSQPGGPVHVFPCTKRWHNYFSIGNGDQVVKGALFTTVPLHTRNRIAETGRHQEAYMCLGVMGRGEGDEEDWLGDRSNADEEDFIPFEDDDEDDDDDGEEEDEDGEDIAPTTVAQEEEEEEEEAGVDEGFAPLELWEDKHLVATKCSNEGAVIEWVIVPFIKEDDINTVADNIDVATPEDDGGGRDEL